MLFFPVVFSSIYVILHIFKEYTVLSLFISYVFKR